MPLSVRRGVQAMLPLSVHKELLDKRRPGSRNDQRQGGPFFFQW